MRSMLLPAQKQYITIYQNNFQVHTHRSDVTYNFQVIQYASIEVEISAEIDNNCRLLRHP